LMIMQTRQVWEIFTGKDSGWSPQRRNDGRTPWPVVMRRHASQSIMGLLIAGSLWLLSPQLLIWLSLPLAGLAVAPLLSRISGSAAVGRGLRRIGLLLTPEETTPWRVDLARQGVLPAFQRAAAGATLNRL